MSVTITFNPDSSDGEVKDNKTSYPKGLVYLSVRAEASDQEYSGFVSGWTRPEVRALVKAAPDMHAILDELEGAFDKEIYPEQKTEDFDALDDREYTVTITAKQWRALGRALGKAQGAT